MALYRSTSFFAPRSLPMHSANFRESLGINPRNMYDYNEKNEDGDDPLQTQPPSLKAQRKYNKNVVRAVALHQLSPIYWCR